MKRAIRIALICVFAGVFLFSGYRVASILLEDNRAKSTYVELLERFRPTGQTPSSEPSAPEPSGGTDDPHRPTQRPEPIAPNGQTIEPRVDAAALATEYPAFAGWLYCPDTEIDYPVAQSRDHFYYLNHLLDGSYNRHGCLFIDFNNSNEFTNRNTIFYGHKTSVGLMFGTLLRYKEPAYYAEHPTFYFQTERGTTVLEIVAAYSTDAYSEAYTYDFTSDEAFLRYIEEAVRCSEFQSGVTVDADDRIVTLSTCENVSGDARFVVICRVGETK